MNYRKFYEKEVCKIPDGFVIHHIDFDRNNNKIHNLVMLPSRLHSQYHFYKTQISHMNEVIETKMTLLANCCVYRNKKYIEFLVKFQEIYEECCRWVIKKEVILSKENHECYFVDNIKETQRG